jgi:hypothetical protein
MLESRELNGRMRYRAQIVGAEMASEKEELLTVIDLRFRRSETASAIDTGRNVVE